MPFMRTAMASAIFSPFCPPIAPPTSTSMTLSRISSTPVRKIFIRVPPIQYAQTRQIFRGESRAASVDGRNGCATWLDSRRGRGLFFRNDGELHLLSRRIAIDAYMLAWRHFALQDQQGERILNHPLNRAAQRSRPVRWIVALAEN